ILVLLASGIGAAVWSSLQPAPPTKVVVAKAEKVPLLRSLVSATGEIRAKEFVDIQTEVAGVIVELLVKEGDEVQEGQVLLRLDALQLQAEVDSMRAQVGAAEADARSSEVGVATAEANLAAEQTALANAKVEAAQSETSQERARSSFARKQQMFDKELIGREEYEISKAEARLAEQRLDFANARIKQAEANVRAAVTRVEAAKAVRDASQRRLEAQQASLARAVDMASKTVIKAPLSGLITACNVEKGERAVPGIQSNPVATLMTIADMSVIEAEIEVDEADIVSVKLGAKAQVEVDAIRDLKLTGIVTEIGQSPIMSTDNQEGKEFKVVVRIDNPPEELRPGFTATAEIETATRVDCLVVPLQALTVRERERDTDGKLVVPPKPVEGREVYAAETSVSRKDLEEVEGVFLLIDGVARFRPVETGITGDMDIEVLSGLQPGEEVVIGPYQKLRKLSEWDRAVIDEKKQKNAISVRQP
ncbi:MAG: efflux RND transporter periplasmic adaptor subunit, partial [Planctomycetes bacterium]|nr:efflux RND transporter periplasmic adaptor subunit [Planctomycetota bacterium]